MGDEISVQPFRTPRGHSVSMAVRADTSDWNTLNSCLTEDEYELRDLHLEGWALDIGAHTGGVTVALAADNPELQVVAVEPVPDNVELLRRNLAANGLDDRVVVIEGAAGDGREVNIRYGYSGSELATHHAFIGNVAFLEEPGPENPHTVRKMRSLTLAGLADGRVISFVKIDAEGAEWDCIEGLRMISHVRGEWHPVRSHTQDQWRAALEATHEVTFSGPVEGPGGFVAVRR